MYNRVLCTVILIAFLNSILGCTKIVTISMDEARVPLSPMIVGVVLLSGAKILFDESGGSFDAKNEQISGIRDNGEPVVYKLSHINSVHIQYNRDDRASLREVDIETLRNRTNYVEEIKVVQAVLISGDKTKFDKDKGNIDYENQSLVGTSKQGEQINLPFDDVASLRVPDEKSKPEAGLFLTAIVLAVPLSFLVLYLAYKKSE